MRQLAHEHNVHAVLAITFLLTPFLHPIYSHNLRIKCCNPPYCAAGRTVLQSGGRSPSYSADFMLGYTTAVHKYQTQLQLQQQQQAATVSSTSDRKLLQSGGRSPTYSPEFAAAYTAAVQKYLIQLQRQQQQQQVAAASTSDATSGADGSRRLLQTGGRAPGFSAEFIAAYTAAVQKHQAEVKLQQQQQGAAPMSEVNEFEGGRKLQQTGGRAPAYNEAFMAGYNAAVRQYQALLLQQKQQQQQVQAAAASKPAGSGGN
jgi:hypothetical protein